MPTIAEMMPEYNALCKKKGLPEMPRWRGTAKDLERRISRLKAEFATPVRPAVARGAYQNARLAAQATGHTERGPTAETRKAHEKEAKATSKKAASAPKRTDRDELDPPNSERLAVICQRLGIEPRGARMKLRAAYEGGGKLPKLIDDKWLWHKKDVPAVEKLIKGDDKKKKK